ncbi:hypothetical protein ACH4ZU_37100 [Streptomyces sp. NPDC020472]|uniref:hypothetical protein n=1 Tax=Streptomyces sp. NPDC020472 TaxID=3365075 RepID=UPI0037A204AD
MKITKSGLSACAVAALLAGAVACTSEGGGTAERTTRTTGAVCANGTYTWSDVDVRDVLTGVAEKQQLGKGGGALTHEPAPLHVPATAVTFEKGPRVDARAVLRSLAARVGEADAAEGDDHEFTDVHRPAPDFRSDATSVDGAGTFVEYAWVREVGADFQYSCGDGRRAAGHAVGWTVDGSGVLECSTPVTNAKAGEMALEAARLSCGPDSPAARAKRA